MESGIKRTQKDYTLAFKLAVVEQVEKGELTYKEAQHRYGIQGCSTVLVCMRKHGRQGWGIHASSAAMPRDKIPIPLTSEQQIKALQVQLKEANDKAQLLKAVLGYGVKTSPEEGLWGARRKKAFGQVLAQQLIQGLSV